MPYKFNTDRRDRIPKQKHRVTNWAEYNEGLRADGLDRRCRTWRVVCATPNHAWRTTAILGSSD